MKLSHRVFWIAWSVLSLLFTSNCIREGWTEDTALLGVAYGLSLLSTWLCHSVKPGMAFGNLIVMVVYNAIWSYNLAFNSQYGTGLLWWFLAFFMNTNHSLSLLIYYLYIRLK